MKKILTGLLILFVLLSVNTFASSRAVQVYELLVGLEDISGNPLSGYKVTTYLAGTSTAVSLWTDSAMNTAATNPIILDSNGRANVYGDGLYKFVITTDEDASYDTWDNLAYFYYTPDHSGTVTVSGQLRVINNGTAIVVDQKIAAYDSGGLELASDDEITRVWIMDDGKVSVNVLLTDRIGAAGPGNQLVISSNIIASGNLVVSGDLKVGGNITGNKISITTTLNAANIETTGNVNFSNMPYLNVNNFQSVKDTMANGATATINFYNVSDNVGFSFNDTTSMNTFTVSQNGTYVVQLNGYGFASGASDSTTTILLMRVLHNNNQVFQGRTGQASDDNFHDFYSVVVRNVKAGDTFAIQYKNNTGVTATPHAANDFDQITRLIIAKWY